MADFIPPQVRIEGAAKVTGAARFTSDEHPAQLVYGAAVQSTIARGKIASVEVADALAIDGVLNVWCHANMPRLHKASGFPMGAAWQKRLPLQDREVTYRGELVGLVVAETLEAAREAAAAVRVSYIDCQEPVATLSDGLARNGSSRIASLGLMQRFLSEDTRRGDAAEAFAREDSVFRVDQKYETARQLHMAMEPHATVAWWNDDELTVREASQWLDGAQDIFATWFGIRREQVRVLSAFVGGGFGLRIGVLPHAALAAMAARELGRPVSLVLDRAELCRLAGGRPATHQRVRLAADSGARLTAMVHDTVNESGRDSVFNEPGSRASKSTYAVANYRAEHSVVQLDIAPPAWMRAPGEAPGSFAIESAMDELAYACAVDPIELRLRNYAENEPGTGKPWSTKHLREAYARGAEAFGWAERLAAPRGRCENGWWVGMGMATAGYSAKTAPSEARLRLTSNGRIALESRGVDIGTGAYTAMALVIAQILGIEVGQVDVRLGDSQGARSSWAGGSMMTTSLGAAVHGAALKLGKQLIRAARTINGSPFACKGSRLRIDGGFVRCEPGDAAISFSEIMVATGRASFEAFHRTHPTWISRVAGPKAFTSMAAIAGPNAGERAVHSWGAQFAEVAVAVDTGEIRVRRLLGAFDCGHILNPLTARSQLLGGMVMGMGMALSEGMDVDSRSAALVNGNLGDYLVPVHADVPDMEVIFVGEFDPFAGPLGGKPVGEVGITGVAAAIANAAYNATGQRLRRVPLKLCLSSLAEEAMQALSLPR